MLIEDNGVRIMAKHEANPNAMNIADRIIDGEEFIYYGA